VVDQKEWLGLAQTEFWAMCRIEQVLDIASCRFVCPDATREGHWMNTDG
jgi:hypothetical protein